MVPNSDAASKSMVAFYLESAVAVFVVFALLIWVASAFTFTAFASTKWYLWGWTCVGIAIAAQLLLFAYQHFK